MRTVRGLLLACHPGPTLAVTVLAAGLAAFAGASSGAVVALASCVLVGQVSIGWANDAHDAVDDTAAGRDRKPVVRGMVSARAVWRAALVALGSAVVLSFGLLGWVAGGLHVVAVLAAWAYNLGLKDTVWSALPYALAFGLVPQIVMVVAGSSGGGRGGGNGGGADVGHVSTWALVVIGAMLGAGAHLANTAPDVASDRAVGRGGVAVVIGSLAARTVAVACCAVSAGVLVAAMEQATGLLVRALVAQVVLLGLIAAWRGGRWLFPTMLLLTGANTVALAVLG